MHMVVENVMASNLWPVGLESRDELPLGRVQTACQVNVVLIKS
jgi:hypothetical protein